MQALRLYEDPFFMVHLVKILRKKNETFVETQRLRLTDAKINAQNHNTF
jgi:hypothetical protein